jgi:hypothetical protein
MYYRFDWHSITEVYGVPLNADYGITYIISISVRLAILMWQRDGTGTYSASYQLGEMAVANGSIVR